MRQNKRTTEQNIKRAKKMTVQQEKEQELELCTYDIDWDDFAGWRNVLLTCHWSTIRGLILSSEIDSQRSVKSVIQALNL